MSGIEHSPGSTHFDGNVALALDQTRCAEQLETYHNRFAAIFLIQPAAIGNYLSILSDGTLDGSFNEGLDYYCCKFVYFGYLWGVSSKYWHILEVFNKLINNYICVC